MPLAVDSHKEICSLSLRSPMRTVNNCAGQPGLGMTVCTLTDVQHPLPSALHASGHLRIS